MLTKVAAVFVLVFALSACTGGDDSPSKPAATKSPSSKSGSTATPSNPPCASIWKKGAKLNKGYHGCAKRGSKETSVRCENGAALVVFDETYFAITGGKITKSSASPLEDSEAYGRAFATCTGE